MAVVGTANRHLIVYQLEGQPQEYKQIESPLKYQVGVIDVTALSSVVTFAK